MSFLQELKNKVLAGEAISKDEAIKLIDTDLDELMKASHEIKNKFANHVSNLCTILNAKSGRCPEDCKYCAQSAHYNTGVEEYSFLEKSKILEAAEEKASHGVDYFSIVTSGRKLSKAEIADLIDVVKEIKEKTNLKICASLGILSLEEMKSLKDAGVSNYHHNLQTSREFFDQIITTHTFDQKVQTIKNALDAGLDVCSGGIVGLGESFEDRISLAFTLKEIGIKNIPINILVPIHGTPLENNEKLPHDEILRIIAITRFINPGANMIYGAGRGYFAESEFKGYLAGMNSAITGTCLTTQGSDIARDKDLIKKVRETSL